MIQIDGSYLEGGGQVLRTALAFSSLTLQPFEIFNIRKGRPSPGLQPQHLACIKALEDFCNASSEGAVLNSGSVKFYPGKLQSRTLNVDIGTAGSVTLLLQAILLPALFAPGKVRLRLTGGTNVSHSQPVEYFGNVFLPHLSGLAKAGFHIMQRGYFPKGSGRVEMDLSPFFNFADFGTFQGLSAAIMQQHKGINLTERGRLLNITGISHASADLNNAEVAGRQASSARQQLQKSGISCPISITSEYSSSLSTGSGISMFAHFAAAGKEEQSMLSPVILGADCLGERGKRAEIVGQEAAAALAKEIDSGACVDRYLADQLIPLMALAGGKILASEITNHCITNIFVVEQFIGKCFSIDSEKRIISTIS